MECEICLLSEMSLCHSSVPYSEEVHESAITYHGDGCQDDKVLAANFDIPPGPGNYLIIYLTRYCYFHSQLLLTTVDKELLRLMLKTIEV